MGRGRERDDVIDAEAAVRELREPQPDADQDFDVFFRRYYPRLVRFLIRRCGDPDLAEDLSQDAITRAITTSDRWDWERSMWPLLKSIATNLLIDHVRRTKREVISEELPEQRRLPAEKDELILESLKGLPQRQRVALALRYIEDWRAADAASYLGLSVPAFDQLAFRARSSFRKEYERVSLASRALVVLPVRRMRSALDRVASWARMPDLVARASEAAMQAAAGALCLVTAASATTPAPATMPLAAPRAERESAGAGRTQLEAPTNAAPSVETAAVARPGGDGIGGSSSTPQGEGPADPERALEDLTDPNRRVSQPEDAELTSMAASPNYDDDRTLFASGATHCRLPACSTVLFESRDGGESWKRLPASGFQGTQLLLPPRWKGSDYPIFAMGPTGLQVSTDSGRSFSSAALGGAPFAVGSAAISPAFGSGDPTVLIGAQTMMRYDAEQAAVIPAPYTAIPGPMEPAYTPEKMGSAIYVGAIKNDGPEFAPVVYRCDTAVCWEGVLEGGGQQIPKIRFDDRFASNRRVYAFTENAVYRSTGVGSEFVEIDLAGAGLITDVRSMGGRLFVSTTTASGKRSAVFRRSSSGERWTRLAHPLLRGGVQGLTVLGDRTLVALLDGAGLACSHDAGETWSRRC